ncbi:MAG TPA: LysR family transcriptional regulator [Casimicrobiaceae bacterium]|jgi:DNA-binding transcriptional LysR family regulator|nr:LysR family transcriptional regulator [Casimicrobiaceae bacterium]
MNISLRQLRAFAAVAQLASFTKAADALHATQPALSAQIQELEDALGVRLFDRSTRSVTITKAGRDLLPVVDKILADVSLVMTHARDVARKNVGRVVIAALPSVSSTLLPQEVVRFRALHPGVAVTIKDALAERIVRMIRDDEVDFGLTSAPASDAQLEFTPLASDHMVAVLPRRHPLAAAKRLDLADLLDGPLILMDRDSSVRRIVDQACAALGRIATPAHEPAFMATAIGMVRAGLGATVLPSSAFETTTASDLVVHTLDHPQLTRQLGILKKRERSHSPAAAAFVETLREHAKDWFRSNASTSRKRPAGPHARTVPSPRRHDSRKAARKR